MRAFLILLLALMAASLTATSMSHARQAGAGQIGAGQAGPGQWAACEGAVHSDDDGGAPTDADRALPHHHATCHAPALAGTGDLAAPAALHGGAIMLRPGRAAPLRDRRVDPGLRPPSARH